MSSIIFYTPDGHHRLANNGANILFVTDIQHLHQGIINSNHTRPIVCICCQNPSPIINELPPNALIYLCRFHSGSVNLPNVREDVAFGDNGNWIFTVTLNRIQQTGINGNRQELLADIQILWNITQQVALQPQAPIQNQNPIPIQNQNQNPNPNPNQNQNQNQNPNQNQNQNQNQN